MNAWIVGRGLMKYHCLIKEDITDFRAYCQHITDVDYRHKKTVFEYLINKNLGDYHNLYVQGDTLLFSDVFESFRNMCIKVNELDPAHVLSARGLAWQACLKKTKVQL